MNPHPAHVASLRRNWPTSAIGGGFRPPPRYLSLLHLALGFRNERACHFFEVGYFGGCGAAHVGAYQLLATVSHLIVGFGILTSCAQQFFEPVLAIACVHGLISPVEIHVVFA